MVSLNILYKPKSILGLLVAGGILFLLIAGLTLTLSDKVSQFFLTWGSIFLTIGIVGWLFYIVPGILRNLGR